MKPTSPERRFRPRPELRVDGDGAGTLTGFAVVYDSLSQDLGGFCEKMTPGCFGDLSAADIRCLLDHDTAKLLGRTTSRTLDLSDETEGLRITCRMPDVSYARDLRVLVGRQDLDGMSFGFYCLEDDWEVVGGILIRTIRRAELIEVSAVTFPAYPETSVAIRSRDLWKTRQQSEPAAAAELPTAATAALNACHIAEIRQARFRLHCLNAR